MMNFSISLKLVLKTLYTNEKSKTTPFSLDNTCSACDTNSMEKLPVKLIKPTAKPPVRQTEGSVGYDISACIEQDIIIKPGQTHMIGSGFIIALEPGYAAFIYARSGLGIKQGIAPANCVGVVDSDYRGEVIVGLRNSSQKSFTVKNGDRIAQMVIAKCELPEISIYENLDDTLRGQGGFGSTDERQL